MAVLALLVSPVTAAAAQVACGQDRMAMMPSVETAAMPGMTQAAPDKGPSSPCCDPGAAHKTMDSRSCAQACATFCAAAVAMPGSAVTSIPGFVRAALNPGPPVLAQAYEPLGLKRPPKSMA